MHRLILLCCLALSALLAACAPIQPRPQAALPTASADAPVPVLLVSIDGFRADYFDRGHAPTLSALAATGVHARWMTPSFPSLTFPNHYTLVTGLVPDHHGIVNNTMYDPALGRFSLGREKAIRDGRWWDQGEPLWVSADKAGIKTATMFWPGSEAKIRGHRPDYWLPFDGDLSAAARVAQVLQWLDLPAAQRPRFLTLYFDAVDHAGHQYGPDSPQVNQAISRVDGAIAALVRGLKARKLFHHINLVVVSDHGMAATPAGQYVYMDQLIDMDHVHVTAMGVLAGFAAKPGHRQQVQAKLLGRHAHMTCWRKADIPARYHYGANPRVPPIDCLADVGWQITTTGWVARHKHRMSLGNHGYDNTDPHMRALFVAHGPAFAQGRVVAPYANVDVYPLLTHLLGIKPAPNDGDFSAIKDVLRATTH